MYLPTYVKVVTNRFCAILLYQACYVRVLATGTVMRSVHQYICPARE